MTICHVVPGVRQSSPAVLIIPAHMIGDVGYTRRIVHSGVKEVLAWPSDRQFAIRDTDSPGHDVNEGRAAASL